MPTYPITVTTRAGKGSQLNTGEHDHNLNVLKDAANDLNTRVANITSGSSTAGNADKVDNFHASQTPGASTVAVAGSGGKLAPGWLPAATDSAVGGVELATGDETKAGADATRAVTPAGLNASRGIDPEKSPRNSDLGTAARLDQTWYEASTTWDAPSIANGAQASTTVSVPGAELGDCAMASASGALSGLALRGEVTAQDVVTLYLGNQTGGAVNLGSLTYNVRVMARLPRR